MKIKTRVVHCRKEKYDVYIGRPGKWGNPFRLGKKADRVAVLEKYRFWLLQQKDLLAQLHELQGKVLGCWCKPELCHGDVLADLANSQEQTKNPQAKSQTQEAKKLTIVNDPPVGR